MDDMVSRQAAISLQPKPKEDRYFQTQNLDDAYDYGWYDLQRCIEKLPPVKPEPAIPLKWIEAQIEWLKSLDNAFSTLTAVQISAMVNKWKDEQDG